MIVVCQLTVRDRDRHGNRQRSSRRHFFIRDIPAIAKESCVKERIQGKETAPVNTSEMVKKSEVNYIFATCNRMHATLHLKITT